MLLPTNQNMWDGFQSLVSEEVGVVKESPCMGGWVVGWAAHQVKNFLWILEP